MYSPEQREKIQNEVCSRMANGESLIAICRSDHMPNRDTILAWANDDKEFSGRYARAREALADFFLDQILEISDQSELDTEIDPESGNERTNHEVIQRSKLRVDTRKWAMSKMAPRKYGDKILHGGDAENPFTMLLKSVQGASLPINSSSDTDE